MGGTSFPRSKASSGTDFLAMRHWTIDVAQTAGLQVRGKRVTGPSLCLSTSRENPVRSHWDRVVGATLKVCASEPCAEEQPGVLPAELGACSGKEISGGGGEGGAGSDVLHSQCVELRDLQKHIWPGCVS